MPATDLALSDLHIQLLASALVPPGEKLVARSVGKKTPWWSLGMMSKTFVLLATERRLKVLEHGWNPFTGRKLHAAHPSSAPPPVNPVFGQPSMTAALLPSGHWPR
jgi:hypothetical protein